MHAPEQYLIEDNGTFPNSTLPVLVYRQVLHLPLLFPAATVENQFTQNGWTNNWKNGIYPYHHYHSVTHEAMGCCKGQTSLQLGGDDGILINFEKGDVIIIPAGVAHKNMGEEEDVMCVGGYPNGKDFDMNYGREGERQLTDQIIAHVPIPDTDPVMGFGKGLVQIWLKL